MWWALTAALLATTGTEATVGKASPPTPVDAGRVERTVRYALTLTNRASERLVGAAVRIFAPVRQTSLQRAVAITISRPHALLADEHGNQALEVHVDLAPRAVDTIVIEARVEFVETPTTVRIDDPAPWLASGRYVEVHAPEITRIARQLGGSTATEVATHALDFVAGHLTADGYSAEERGARAALTAGEGDCTESMYLFVALLRARGVPARGVSGFVVQGNATLHAAELHDWAEYHDGVTWQIADPNRRVLHPRDEQYLAMLILDERRSPLLNGMRRFWTSSPALDVRLD